MSFSNKTPVTPAQQFIKWVGSKGDLSYYDKEAKERKVISIPRRFVVLDQLNSIGGYSKLNESGIWANEVRNTKEEELVVRTNVGEIERGLYNDIKDRVKTAGGKYQRNVYALLEDDDKSWKIVKIMLTGAALSAWFDYSKANNPEEWGVNLVEAKQESNGATTFFVPVFEPFAIPKELVQRATDADQQLQKYLSTYAKERREEGDKDQALAEENIRDVVIEDVDDKPIDLSEIPF